MMFFQLFGRAAQRKLVLMGALTLLMLAGASQAGAVTDRGDACGTGVCGSATFTWLSAYEMYPISMSVKDTACDSHPVYIRFVVYNHSAANSGWRTTKRWNSSGCQANAAVWNNLRLHDGADLIAVKVETCVDDAGSDTCYLSPRLNSPFW